MDNLNQIGLVILAISDIMTAKNGRRYKQLTVSPVYEGGFKSNQTRKRLVWEEFTDEQGRQFNGDQLFYHAEEGDKIVGEIKEVEIEDYWIESENGKSSHPKTGNPANKINSTTVVLFDGETVQSQLDNGMRLKGDKAPATPAQQPQKTSPVIQDELEEEDEEVELS